MLPRIKAGERKCVLLLCFCDFHATDNKLRSSAYRAPNWATELHVAPWMNWSGKNFNSFFLFIPNCKLLEKKDWKRHRLRRSPWKRVFHFSKSMISHPKNPFDSAKITELSVVVRKSIIDFALVALESHLKSITKTVDCRNSVYSPTFKFVEI